MRVLVCFRIYKMPHHWWSANFKCDSFMHLNYDLSLLIPDQAHLHTLFEWETCIYISYCRSNKSCKRPQCDLKPLYLLVQGQIMNHCSKTIHFTTPPRTWKYSICFRYLLSDHKLSDDPINWMCHCEKLLDSMSTNWKEDDSLIKWSFDRGRDSDVPDWVYLKLCGVYICWCDCP